MRVSAGFAAQADSFSSVSHRRCGSRDRFAADPEHQKIIDTAADRLGFAEAGGDVNRAHETRTQGFPEPRVFGGGIELTGTNCLLDNEGTALAHAVYAFALSSTARLRLNSNPDRHLPAAVRAMSAISEAVQQDSMWAAFQCWIPRYASTIRICRTDCGPAA